MILYSQDKSKEWNVQSIIGEARDRDGRIFYLVRWADQPNGKRKWSLPEYDWWLPEEECSGCEGAVREYNKNKTKKC